MPKDATMTAMGTVRKSAPVRMARVPTVFPQDVVGTRSSERGGAAWQHHAGALARSPPGLTSIAHGREGRDSPPQRVRQGRKGRRARLAGPHKRLRSVAPDAGLAEEDGRGEEGDIDGDGEEEEEEDVRDVEEGAPDHGSCAVLVVRVEGVHDAEQAAGGEGGGSTGRSRVATHRADTYRSDLRASRCLVTSLLPSVSAAIVVNVAIASMMLSGVRTKWMRFRKACQA